MPDRKPRIAPDSLLCGQALGSTILRTSRDCGWTSALLDHHRVDPAYDAFETRATPDQTIVVMRTGEQAIEAFGGGTWRRAHYRAGTIGMTQGGQVDRLRRRQRPGQRPFEKVNLYIPQALVAQAADHYRRAGQGTRRPLTALAFHDPLILHTVASLVRGMAAGLPDIYAETAACWLATHLLSAHGQVDPARPGTVPSNRIEAVREMVHARFAEALSLDDLAAEAGISKFHFARLFREGTGSTPHAYIVRTRVEAAARLLAETDLRVKQIAAQTGFHSVASLGSAFLRERGVTPSAFRQGARRPQKLTVPNTARSTA